MTSFEIRPFRRSDRDQVVALVNAHAAAVIPGVSASTNTVLGQFEREPREHIVDPWVVDRLPLVAEQSNGIVGAALLLRYGTHELVSESYRDAGDIRWFLFTPLSPPGSDIGRPRAARRRH